MNELFTRPELWPFLLLAVPAWLLIWWLVRQRSRARRHYGAPLEDRVPSPWGRATRVCLAGVLLCLTAMEPRHGKEQVKVERRGLDIIFCLDTSRSMLAQDMAPNRLARAKRDILSVLRDLAGGDRVGLVAFAGKAKVVVPLTHDMDSLRQLLDAVDTDTVPRGGTHIAAAVNSALDLISDDDYQTSVIIVLTDGEDHGGKAQQAARKCKDRDVILHAVGYGSTKGSKITLSGQGDEEFLKNNAGAEVVSALRSESLRQMSEVAGGEFLRADVTPLPLRELKTKRLDPLAKRSYEAGEETIYQSRFQWTLLPAILLLLWDMLCLGGWRR
jgi:Ca-activated chloride channel family protein